MRKEIISLRQAICMICLFVFGSSVVMGVSSDTAQDSWITLLLTMTAITPVLLMYARIIKLYPGKDVCEIFQILFGKAVGKALIVVFVWYAVHLGALVLKNFAEYAEVVAMPETPQLPLMIFMLVIVIYLAKAGVETMGKWAVIVICVVGTFVLITLVLSVQHYDFSHVFPVGDHTPGEFAFSVAKLASFPFAETVLFLSLASFLDRKTSPYKTFLYGAYLGGLVLMLVLLRNLFVLGPLMQIEYFPSHTEARIICLVGVLERIEGLISFNFILAGMTKITVCVLAATKGLSRLFEEKDYRRFVFPVSILVLALCISLYKNIMEMFEFINYYPIYASLFELGIPLAVWIAAEIKTKLDKKSKKEPPMLEKPASGVKKSKPKSASAPKPAKPKPKPASAAKLTAKSPNAAKPKPVPSQN